MTGWLSLLLVSIGISLDGFAVGLTYGLRKMKLPISSLLLVSFCSFAVVFSVMSLGRYALDYLSPETGKILGALILIGIGLIALYRMWKSPDEETPEQHEKEPSEEASSLWTIRMFGLLIHILKDPSRADRDKSGHVIGWEAVLLGFALSLDACGAALSLLFMGYHRVVTAIGIGVTGGALLLLGTLFGRKCNEIKWMQKLTYVPPFLLMAIGICKIFI